MTRLIEPRIEPVYLELEPARITEHGKRWLETKLTRSEKWGAIFRDLARLADIESWKWPQLERQLRLEGVPTAITSGISQFAMPKVLNLLAGTGTLAETTTFGFALATTAPTSTTTGATLADGSMYTGYSETNVVSNMGTATAATPSVLSNSSTITGAACTGSTSTILGFALKDGTTVGSGNVLFYGTTTSTVISTTATPPTVASGALSLSITGS